MNVLYIIFIDIITQNHDIVEILVVFYQIYSKNFSVELELFFSKFWIFLFENFLTMLYN